MELKIIIASIYTVDIPVIQVNIIEMMMIHVNLVVPDVMAV